MANGRTLLLLGVLVISVMAVIFLSLPVSMTGLIQESECAHVVTNPPFSSVNKTAAQQHTAPILFVHFHKSGGTSVCRTMQKQNRTFITDGNGKPIDGNFVWKLNCNAPFSATNIDVRIAWAMQTCAHLLPYTTNKDGIPFTRNNLVAVEVPFQKHDKPPCPGFRNFAIMRNPVSRTLSHMLSHRWGNEAKLTKYIKEKTPCSENYYMDGYPVVNSMVIRQLLGRERYIDTRPVNQDDLEKAKTIVDRFHVFVPLEHLHHPNVTRLLEKNVPEYYAGLMQHNLTVNTSPRANEGEKYTPDAKFLHLIEDENKFDTELYHYVLSKLGITSQ